VPDSREALGISAETRERRRREWTRRFLGKEERIASGLELPNGDQSRDLCISLELSGELERRNTPMKKCDCVHIMLCGAV